MADPVVHSLRRHDGGPTFGNAWWTASVVHHGITYYADNRSGDWALRVTPDSTPLCLAGPLLHEILQDAVRDEMRARGEHVTDARNWRRVA